MENEKNEVFQAADLKIEEQTKQGNDTSITADELAELNEIAEEEQPSSEDNLETGEDEEAKPEAEIADNAESEPTRVTKRLPRTRSR